MTTPQPDEPHNVDWDNPFIVFTQADIERTTSFALKALPETDPNGRVISRHLRELRVGKLRGVHKCHWKAVAMSEIFRCGKPHLALTIMAI